MKALFKSLAIAGSLSLGTVFVFVLAALFAPLLAPYSPDAVDPMNILAVPSSEHLLGTDEVGRDIFSRILFGARISLVVAVSAVLVAAAIGVPLGLGMAFCGRAGEAFLVRVVDLLIALPEIFVAILVLAFFGGDLKTLVGTIGFLYAPQFARVSHSMAVSIRAREHVQAAASLGAGRIWIIRNEILPNAWSIVVVQASFTFSFSMLLEAGLSFLGFGVQPPTPSWGQMIATLKNYLFINPFAVLAPCFMLFVIVLAINILGDRLQDSLNPELRT